MIYQDHVLLPFRYESTHTGARRWSVTETNHSSAGSSPGGRPAEPSLSRRVSDAQSPAIARLQDWGTLSGLKGSGNYAIESSTELSSTGDLGSTGSAGTSTTGQPAAVAAVAGPGPSPLGSSHRMSGGGAAAAGSVTAHVAAILQGGVAGAQSHTGAASTVPGSGIAGDNASDASHSKSASAGQAGTARATFEARNASILQQQLQQQQQELQHQQQQPGYHHSSDTDSSVVSKSDGASNTAAHSRTSTPGSDATATSTTQSSRTAAAAASNAVVADAGGAAVATQPVVTQPAPPAATADSTSATTASSSSDDAYAGLLPGYSVGRVVGEGGFCQVRLGIHHLSRRKVAIKVIDKTKLSDPNEAKRMQREIRVLKRLSHECVIKLFEVLDAEGRLYLVMEYAPQGSLLDYVRQRKRLSEAEACYFLQQIVAGLQYCHANEVSWVA